MKINAKMEVSNCSAIGGFIRLWWTHAKFRKFYLNITSFLLSENTESSQIFLIFSCRIARDLMKTYYLKSKTIADLNSVFQITFNIEMTAMSTAKLDKTR